MVHVTWFAQPPFLLHWRPLYWLAQIQLLHVQRNGDHVLCVWHAHVCRYLQMVVEELKPFMDATYRTLPQQQHTAMMGSSMGALLSLYALQQHPDGTCGAFQGSVSATPAWPSASYCSCGSHACC